MLDKVLQKQLHHVISSRMLSQVRLHTKCHIFFETFQKQKSLHINVRQVSDLFI